MRAMQRLFILAALLALSGCSSVMSTGPAHDPAFAAARPPRVSTPVYSTGAIFQAGNDMRLFENQVSRRVGDILTVKLVEQTTGKKKADQQVQKQNSISASAPVLFGQNPSHLFGAAANILASGASAQPFDAELTSDKNFKGTGDSNQSNALTGDISVTVVEVLSNGNLRVQGEKRITMNQGDEFVRLSGYVRPLDIDDTNSVASNRIADATIIYTGEGALADGSRMGWMGRFFNSVLFPF
ncbi:MAG: flagellar basal body L-ring protein [Methylococcaceae bacterium]|nr:MAG: flagellar basal body L-ring protein [Methylococcaceae bacterium]